MLRKSSGSLSPHRRARVLALLGAAVAALLFAPPAQGIDIETTKVQPLDLPLRALASRHDLGIGTAVDMSALATDTTYRATVASEFSTVTPENVMKWQLVEPQRGQFDYAAADELVAFARANHQKVRGHTLVWHNQLPNWLTSGTFTADELRAILRQHIIDEATHFKGQIWQWDVVNEAFNDDGTLRDTLWLRNLGPGYIADAFRWAHEADPKAALYYNDFNLEGLTAKTNAVFAMAQQLLADGVPIDGVGIQGHLGTQFGFFDVNNMTRNLKRFTDLGLQVAFTEADVRMVLPVDNLKVQSQSQGYSGMMQACLYNPGCVSFTVWGFTDKFQWVPGFFTGQGSAALFDENYAPKPAYQTLRMDLAVATGPHHRG